MVRGTAEARVRPYGSYKGSGSLRIMEIPEHWELKRLKFVANTIAGQSPPSEIVSEFTGKSPFLQGNAEFGAVCPNPKLSCETPNKLAEQGDILLSVRAPVGAINTADQRYGIGRGLCAIRAKATITREFLHHSLTITKETLREAATGSTYDAVSVGDIGNIPTPIPPPEEQAAIVRFLDHADEQIQRYIAAKERLIALLEEERQAVVHQAVTRGLDPSVRLKDSRVEWLGDIPEHWENTRARFLLKESDDRSTTGKETHLSMSQVLGLVPSHLVEQSLMSDSYVGGKLCREGDLILNRLKAHLGVFALAKQPGVISPDYSVFHGRESVNMEYVERVFRLPALRTELRSRAKGIVEGLWRLYTHDLFDIRLPTPPLTEQQAIVDHLATLTSNSETAITRTRDQITLMNEYRTRLIADVVTGQLDVRGTATQLPAAP